MRIIEPKHFQYQLKQKKSRKKTRLIAALLALIPILSLGSGTWAYTRPVPAIRPTTIAIKPRAQDVNIAWPAYGQSAIGAVGYGVLADSGITTPAPMASVAKIMTALAVARQKPLALDEQGATLTLTDSDVALYNHYVAIGGSAIAVEEGEELTQYQALQALLLPSANNIADTLVVWAFGSMDGYLDYGNKLTKSLELNDTHIADASGFSPQTVSTARDLVILGQAALAEPVIAQIISQKEANLPVEGIVRNTNQLIDQNGIIGIKTGNTDEAGGCFLFAATRHITDGQTVTVVGAIMGAATLGRAMSDANPLLTSADAGFGNVVAVHANQTVGYYDVPWGERVNIVAQKDVQVFTWKASPPKITVELQTVKAPQQKSKQNVGRVKAQTTTDNQEANAVTQTTLPSPAWRWRLFHK